MPSHTALERAKKKPDAFVEFLNSILEGFGDRFKAAGEAYESRSPEEKQKELDMIMGFAGPGAIRKVLGVPAKITIRGKAITPKRPADTKTTPEGFRSRANTSREGSISEVGFRRNIGGKRPPDAELEALALRKQQAQRVAREDKAMRKEGFKKRTKSFEEEGGSMELSPDVLKKSVSDIVKNIKQKKLKDEERLRKLLEDAFKGPGK